MSIAINATSARLTSALKRVPDGSRANVILVRFSGEKKMTGFIHEVDELTQGLIARRIASDGFEPKFKQVSVIESGLNIEGLDRIILIGLGPRSKLTLNKLRDAIADGFTTARDVAGGEHIIFPLIDVDLHGFTVEQFAQTVTEYAILADYEPNHKKTRDWPGHQPRTHFESLTLLSTSGTLQAAQRGMKAGKLLAEATNRARDMVNEPSNIMTPSKIASLARKLGKESNGLLKVKVLGFDEIKALKMGGVLAVNSGAENPPAFIEMSYDPEVGVTDKVLGFVGKGITFDSGGLNAKDYDSMRDMKNDMGGAAAVLQVMSIICELKPHISVRAVIAACENLTDARSMRQGNVLKTMSGLTVQIDHTDAEGRLTLADALTYVQEKLGANILVDIATLTGSVEEALGDKVTGIFGNNDKFTREVLKCANDAGEPMHELPMYEGYRENNRGTMADLTNDGTGPGAIIAAWFLREFVKDGTPWVHMDIAATNFRKYDHGVDSEGATGVAVRTLGQILRQYSQI